MLYWLFKDKHSVSYHPLSLSEQGPLIFKVSGVKPLLIVITCRIWPLVFKAKFRGTSLPSAGPPCLECLVLGLFLSLIHAYGVPPSCG